MSEKSTPSPPVSPKAPNQTVNQVKAEDSRQVRKRGREGSLEPTGSSQDLQASTSADKSSSSSSAPPPLPKKKNRIVGDSRGGPSPDIDDKLTNVEGSREMELRQGVEGLEVGEEAAGSKMGGVESVGSSSSTGEKEDEDVALPPSTSSNSTSVDPPADDEDGEEMRASTPTPMESGLVPSTDPDDITSISKAASMDDSKTTISTTATVDSNEDISISSVATPIATPVGEQPPILPTAEGVESSDMMDADGILGAAGAAVVGGGEKGLKRKHVVGSDSSLLGRSESYSMETKKAKEDEPVASTSKLPPAPPKPISTGFSSFAASTSPFVSRTLPSSGTSSPFGSAPPSTTTSPTLPSSATIPSTTSSSSTSTKPNVPTFSSFSNTTGASPFSTGTKHTTSTSPFAGSNVFSSFATASPFKPKPATASSFGDILSGGSGGAKEEEKAAEGEGSSLTKEPSVETEGGDSGAAKIASEDMVTGEEGEETRHQVRAKLHVMEDKNGAWKERGTGLCKLNINTATKVPRLIMRADGVFRLILNVALFQGMSCERQDKFVRLIAFENGATLQVALRLGTVKGAEDLFEQLQRLIPKPPAKLNYAMKAGNDEDNGWGV
ncbi:hypothetical protein BDY24DRAFT_392556 [Mrakia frigida]|uniref:uncharacterized protein n=1 Tax=Mrakia frigida TaxID=29902 RepID=UPI003FCBFF09